MVISPTMDRVDDTLVIADPSLWCDLYLSDCRCKLHKATTLTHYGNGLKRFQIWYTTRVPDGEITRRNAKDFIYWLANIKQRFDDHPGRPTEEDHLSPATVRRTVGVVRTFFTWLYDEGYLPRDFAYWFPFPPIRKLPKRVISPSTLEALLQGAAAGEMPARDAALIALLADTGLRRSEVASLAVEQIKWLDKKGGGCLTDVTGKGDRLRTVPFSPVVGHVLQAWLEERPRYPGAEPHCSSIFVTPQGRPMAPDSVYQVLRRCARRAGVEDEVWNTHSFRHNFATHFWRVQRDTKTLSLILGHSSQKITEDVYVHAVSEDLLSAHTSVFTTGEVSASPQPLPRRRQPTREELLTAIRKSPNWLALGRLFAMSDVGVRKMACRYQLLEEYYAARQAA